jgi:hypothetical protein
MPVVWEGPDRSGRALSRFPCRSTPADRSPLPSWFRPFCHAISVAATEAVAVPVVLLPHSNSINPDAVFEMGM